MVRRVLLGVIAALVATGTALLAWLDGGIIDYPLPGALLASRAAVSATGAACAVHRADDRAYTACLSREAPIAALGEYRRCGGYLESQRAGESRIACSKPELTDAFLKLSGEGRSFYREARRACRAHDFCYVHSMATYDPKFGESEARRRCDRMMLADAIRDCRLLFQGNEWNLRQCGWNAMAAYGGVRAGGDEYFNTWNQATCDYEPGAHAPRDGAVSVRFKDGGPDRVLTLVETPDQSALKLELVGFGPDGRSQTVSALSLAASQVPIADREAACKLPAWTSQGDCSAPVTLSQSTFQHWDWMRFPPVVLDSDGDGTDEVILVSLTPYLGLVLTEIRFEVGPEAITFAPPQAFISFDIWSEFGAVGGAVERPLSSEVAIQLAANSFVPVRRATARCGTVPDDGPEDIMLLGASALPEKYHIANRLYRFLYDPATRSWSMRRDRFQEDHHKLRYCDSEKVGTVDQATRLQYPSFAVRGPGRCDAEPPFPTEALATIVREKCPSSTLASAAGDLNDIDLLSYNLDPDYNGNDDQTDLRSKLKMAKTSWLPLIWNEAADPVMTSRTARRYGIAMVSAYTGGTRDNRYPLISVLRGDPRLNDAAKANWWERQPDTLGITPVQYALFESNDRAPRQQWNSELFGDPRMLFQLPSVLAPFWTSGGPGLSLLLFSNRATFDRQPQARYVDAREGSADVIPRGSVQILMAPIVNDGPPNPEGVKPTLGQPRWLQCPVPGPDELADKPARPLVRWRSDFLHHEPVLPGHFFAGPETGGAAIVYRTESGGLGVIGLQSTRTATGSTQWKLAGVPCHSLTREIEGRKARNIWMMRLN